MYNNSLFVKKLNQMIRFKQKESIEEQMNKTYCGESNYNLDNLSKANATFGRAIISPLRRDSLGKNEQRGSLPKSFAGVFASDVV